MKEHDESEDTKVLALLAGLGIVTVLIAGICMYGVFKLTTHLLGQSV